MIRTLDKLKAWLRRYFSSCTLDDVRDFGDPRKTSTYIDLSIDIVRFYSRQHSDYASFPFWLKSALHDLSLILNLFHASILGVK